MEAWNYLRKTVPKFEDVMRLTPVRQKRVRENDEEKQEEFVEDRVRPQGVKAAKKMKYDERTRNDDGARMLQEREKRNTLIEKQITVAEQMNEIALFQGEPMKYLNVM